MSLQDQTNPSSTNPPRIRLIYIAGLGHSGSTLLDMLIASHSKVFSVGEVLHIADYAHLRRKKSEIVRYGNECTCGAEDIWHCPFWTKVEEVLLHRFGRSLKDIDLRVDDEAMFRRNNLELFEAVSEVAGTRILVDSSKAMARLQRLRMIPEIELIPVHLVRGPKGYVWSEMKRKRGLIITALRFSWFTTRIRLQLRRYNGVLAHYERLAHDPRGVLEPIMKRAGLEFEPRQLEWAGKERHNISGNQMRRTTDSTIREDASWREHLGVVQRFVIDVLAAPGLLAMRIWP